MNDDLTLVSVCIATYKRPEGLRKLVESLLLQVLPSDVHLEIVVVDNDPPSAEQCVAEMGTTSRFPIRYFAQPVPNIATTRNLSVTEAKGELIWFIDDDETADPNCLLRLYEVLHQFEADAVFGAVTPQFEVAPKASLASLYARAMSPTGTKSAAYRTGNTLVRSSVLHSIEGPFNAEFGISGGSDSLLFRQLEARGKRLINCVEAEVFETIPATRTGLGWQIDRNRRQGQIYGRQVILLAGGAISSDTGKALVKASAKLLLAVVKFLGSRNDESARYQSRVMLWTAIGQIEGLASKRQTKRT